ncbi:putative elongator complex protein 1 [Sitophilus oryzae]|uniref:Elongator complex protein 1 n=1 Tax=Sitophilus oryzae TaxID=7048 RepID=A0A6J2XZS6_SITOR|nr:putative elongator complex protein 1 [Sitophilus oryzae]
MENVELSVNLHKFDKNLLKNVTRSSIGDHACCFMTERNELCVADNFKDIKIIELAEYLNDNIVQVKYLSFWHCVFVGTENSFIITDLKTSKTVNLQTPTNNITYLSWNPNETCLIVVDKLEHIFALNFQVVITNECPKFKFITLRKAHLNDPVPNSVYVGWGSHNTQFKGSKKIQEQTVIENPQEYSFPKVSWRGNGEQFVINFWRESKRFLKVFDSNLNPLYQSDVYPNLLPITSFKGQGNFIACASEYNEFNKIVIFEKNCLVKSEFLAKHIKGKIKDLQYHPDLHILSIFSECTENIGYLSVYLYSNGHWYLKQQLNYTHDKQLISFYWTNCYDKNYCNLIVLTSVDIEQHFFKLIFDRSLESGLIASIDGDKINFTNISEQIIPPPMSSFVLSFDEIVNRVIFNDGALNTCHIILSNNSIKSYLIKNCHLEEFAEGSSLFSSLNNAFKHSSDSISLYSKEISINNASYNFSLDTNNDLIVDGNIICNNVYSMIIFRNYLLFTHASSKLYCIRLNLKNISASKWDLKNFYSREVEQGAKILSITNTFDIVLILPRGNLETITCRLIAIDIIEKLLEANRWDETVKEMRKQRLNWNLLIDLNPERFCNHIDKFIEAASTISVLNSIVSEFSSENCLKTMYSECLNSEKGFSDIDKKQVISKILDKIITLNPIKNLISVVMLQIKHFSLKSALYSVCQVYQIGDMEICKKSVNQILLHHHVKDVVNESYCLYNLGFLSFIYTCCSEDPRVFEPEIEQLKDLDEIHLRFKMNELGKKFSTATKYLVRCSNYDSIFIRSFITKHVTQHIAYQSLTPKHANFKLASELFATFLSMRSKHNEAGFVLERAGLLQESLNHYQKALNWQRLLILFQNLNLDQDSRKDILLNVANNLVSQKRLEEAVIIYEYYCDERNKAIEVLTQERKFLQAMALAKKYNYKEVIENVIIPSIITYREDLLDRITELGDKFSEYSARLQSLREKKIYKLKQRGLEVDGFIDNDDLHSEYGSIISRDSSLRSSSSSLGSTQSSRNRRKQEKKKIDLREGGVFEDIALIRQLYLLIVDIFGCGQEVKDISSILTDEESFGYAKLLNEKLKNIQDQVILEIPKIWCDTFLNANESPEPDVLGIIQNRSELDIQFRSPPSSELLTRNWSTLIFS